MTDDMDDMKWLEDNHSEYEAQLDLKLRAHEVMVKDDFEVMLKGEVRRRVKIYEDMGMSSDEEMYHELRSFFIKMFAITVVELFEGVA